MILYEKSKSIYVHGKGKLFTTITHLPPGDCPVKTTRPPGDLTVRKGQSTVLPSQSWPLSAYKALADLPTCCQLHLLIWKKDNNTPSSFLPLVTSTKIERPPVKASSARQKIPYLIKLQEQFHYKHNLLFQSRKTQDGAFGVGCNLIVDFGLYAAKSMLIQSIALKACKPFSN